MHVDSSESEASEDDSTSAASAKPKKSKKPAKKVKKATKKQVAKTPEVSEDEEPIKHTPTVLSKPEPPKSSLLALFE